MAGHIASAGRVDWNTPAYILQEVRYTFGGQIELDPCGNENSVVAAAREYRLDLGEDGLVLAWTGKVFVNPPFGRSYLNAAKRVCLSKKEWEELPPEEREGFRTTTILDWVMKASSAAAQGAEVIMLLPASVDTTHWQDFILSENTAICFPRGRLKFIGAAQGAPMACALVYWSGAAGSAGQAAFERAFASIGRIVGNRSNPGLLEMPLRTA